MSNQVSEEAVNASLELSNIYKRVFGTGDGKAVLDDILRHAKVLGVGSQAGVLAEDSHITVANAGRHALGLYILNMVGTDSNFLLGLIKERSQKLAERKNNNYGGFSHV